MAPEWLAVGPGWGRPGARSRPFQNWLADDVAIEKCSATGVSAVRAHKDCPKRKCGFPCSAREASIPLCPGAGLAARRFSCPEVLTQTRMHPAHSTSL